MAHHEWLLVYRDINEDLTRMPYCPHCGSRTRATDRIQIDKGRRAICRRGLIVTFGPVEFELFDLLHSHFGNVVSSDAIYHRLYQLTDDRDQKTILSHVYQMRHKLKPLGLYIESACDCGYALIVKKF